MLVALLLAVVLSGCGSDSDGASGPVAKDICYPRQTEPGDAPEVPTSVPAVTEVTTKDLTKGKGCEIEATPFITLGMIGVAGPDAKVFRNTWAEERPISIQVGGGELIPALETALAGLTVGGDRQITIPAKEALGEEGDPALGIGPNEDLLFIVRLLGLHNERTVCRDVAPSAVPDDVEGFTMPVDVPTKLDFEDLADGEGAEIVAGDELKVDYVGIACSTGQVFDSSWGEGEPLPMTAGADGTIQGFANGVIGAKKGGIRQIIIPADMGYGPQGQPPAIGPNEGLIFLVRFVEVSKPAPATTTTAPAAGATTVPDATTTTAAP